MTEPFKVQLFGRFTLSRGPEPLTLLDSARAQELFAYLLLNRQRSCRREAIAELLWRDAGGGNARKYLRQTLWQLQSVLDASDESSKTLVVEDQWIGVNPETHIWLDVEVLEAAAEQSKNINGRDLEPALAHALRAAVRVYRGDLLESWPQDWCLYERERLLLVFLQLVDKLMSFCEAHHGYDEAIEYGVQILRYDRARERTHRNLMRLHHLAGDRSEALRQYARCVGALRDELDVKPSARTTALYEQILADGTLRQQAPAAGELDCALDDLRTMLTGFDMCLRTALEHLERLASAR
jgi:DNA-binding SARP family transcriptional activator